MSHNDSNTGPSAFRYRVGLNNEAAYIVSGKPFLKAAINCELAPVKVSFPAVTRWVQFVNLDPAGGNNLIVAFAENGLPSRGGDNFMMLEDFVGTSSPGHNTVQLEVKVTEVWIEGSDQVEIQAGLTNVNTNEILNNWSGSVGVG